MSRKKDFALLASGMVLGAALCGGSALASSGVTAQLIPQTFYVDGESVSLTSCMVGGSNYVKLRDIAAAVDFEVYWDGTVQIKTDQPYTGEAPKTTTTASDGIRVSSYKGNTLSVGDRSSLLISPYGTDCTVVSSNPDVVGVETVVGQWVLVAKDAGTATITATTLDGRTGSVTITVTKASSSVETEVDLNANMEIRQEMIRLINQVRRENGVPELVVNEALMNAAQDCAAQGFTNHNSVYECQAGIAYGYPYGFGSNHTWFTGSFPESIAEHAVNNWVNSPGHFQTMIRERYDHIGVGVAVIGKKTVCFMFAGDESSVNFYS